MDSRIRPILDALDACAREMRQHADWMQNLLSRTYTMWAVPGEYEANMAAIQATRNHADVMDARVVELERAWLEPGDHSRFCSTAGCAAACRFREPLPQVPRPAAPVSGVPAKPEPKPEEPKLERFSLIELE